MTHSPSLHLCELTPLLLPQEADSAGLAWVNDTPLPNAPLRGRGNTHNTAAQSAPLPAFGTPQRMGDRGGAPDPVMVTATATPVMSPVYNQNGTIASR
jgi:hypothetical protein